MDTYEEKYNNLIALIADLRDVFPFDPQKDYDSGYPTTNNDGWQTALIVCSPEDCMWQMIEYLKQNKTK
ncbi:MAG: hypothetical protein ACYC5G_05255 [Candidatus Doudnabacteria bacterium]